MARKEVLIVLLLGLMTMSMVYCQSYPRMPCYQPPTNGHCYDFGRKPLTCKPSQEGCSLGYRRVRRYIYGAVCIGFVPACCGKCKTEKLQISYIPNYPPSTQCATDDGECCKMTKNSGELCEEITFKCNKDGKVFCNHAPYHHGDCYC